MNRILITGRNGQVGRELQRTLATLGEIVSLDRSGLDLASPDSIRRAIRETKPNIIVNTAAYTAVDRAESQAGLAMAINGDAPGFSPKRPGELTPRWFITRRIMYSMAQNPDPTMRPMGRIRSAFTGGRNWPASRPSGRPASRTSFSARAGFTGRMEAISC